MLGAGLKCPQYFYRTKIKADSMDFRAVCLFVMLQ